MSKPELEGNEIDHYEEVGNLIFHKDVKSYGSFFGGKATGHVGGKAPRGFEFASFGLGMTKLNKPITAEQGKRVITSLGWVLADDLEEVLSKSMFNKVKKHLNKKYDLTYPVEK